MVRTKRKAKAGNSRVAVGYIRASKDEQRLGPKDQALQLEQWAAREGIALVAVFTDQGLSGGLQPFKRPGLVAALEALRGLGAGVLVAATRLRFAREVTYTRAVEAAAAQAGAKVRSADGQSDGRGANGVMQRGMQDLIGEWERIVISERTTAALAVKRARGERIGEIPYGMRLAGQGPLLEPDPVEQATLSHICTSHANGLSMRKIVEKLNDAGVWARGARWHLTTVARLIAAHAK